MTELNTEGGERREVEENKSKRVSLGSLLALTFCFLYHSIDLVCNHFAFLCVCASLCVFFIFFLLLPLSLLLLFLRSCGELAINGSTNLLLRSCSWCERLVGCETKTKAGKKRPANKMLLLQHTEKSKALGHQEADETGPKITWQTESWLPVFSCSLCAAFVHFFVHDTKLSVLLPADDRMAAFFCIYVCVCFSWLALIEHKHEHFLTAFAICSVDTCLATKRRGRSKLKVSS